MGIHLDHNRIHPLGHQLCPERGDMADRADGDALGERGRRPHRGYGGHLGDPGSVFCSDTFPSLVMCERQAEGGLPQFRALADQQVVPDIGVLRRAHGHVRLNAGHSLRRCGLRFRDSPSQRVDGCHIREDPVQGEGDAPSDHRTRHPDDRGRAGPGPDRHGP